MRFCSIAAHDSRKGRRPAGGRNSLIYRSLSPSLSSASASAFVRRLKTIGISDTDRRRRHASLSSTGGRGSCCRSRRPYLLPRLIHSPKPNKPNRAPHFLHARTALSLLLAATYFIHPSFYPSSAPSLDRLACFPLAAAAATALVTRSRLQPTSAPSLALALACALYRVRQTCLNLDTICLRDGGT